MRYVAETDIRPGSWRSMVNSASWATGLTKSGVIPCAAAAFEGNVPPGMPTVGASAPENGAARGGPGGVKKTLGNVGAQALVGVHPLNVCWNTPFSTRRA